MNEINFKPRFGFKENLTYYTMFAAGLAALFFFRSRIDLLLFGLFLAMVLPLELIFFPRRIIFQPSQIIVTFWFPYVRSFNYSELTDMGEKTIQFGSRDISLTSMSNRYELIDQFENMVKAGRFSARQIRGELLDQEMAEESKSDYTLKKFIGYEIDQKIIWPILGSIVTAVLFSIFGLNVNGKELLSVIAAIALIGIYIYSKILGLR